MWTKRTTIYAKVETTPGSDIVPTAAANAIMAYDVSIEVKGDMKERYAGNVDRSAHVQIRGKTVVDVKFSVELKGSGVAGTAPLWGALMKACDRLEVANTGTNVIYTPAVATSETCTIYANIDGILHKILGCAGDCEIDLTSGEKPMLNFTLSGIYAMPTDIPIAAVSFDTTAPTIVKGTTTTFGSYAAIIEKLILKFGNKIVERTDFNATEGVKSFIVTDRNPAGTMTCEAVLRATTNADFWTYFNGGTSKALSLVLGATSGNIVTIAAPVCVLSAPKYGDRDGLRTFDVDFQMARSVGNDEMTITLT
ncbi:MAG: hypothetical protein PHO03_06535 [Candidatus Omnitrophica bacterium]|nr:hypothetical protein [Candidatus Omnitrophota bacterium]